MEDFLAVCARHDAGLQERRGEQDMILTSWACCCCLCLKRFRLVHLETIPFGEHANKVNLTQNYLIRKSEIQFTVSVYPWEAEGLVEWSSWKWEVRTIWKMLSEGQVFSITPNPLIGIYYYVVLSDVEAETWLVWSRGANNHLDYYMPLKGRKWTQGSLHGRYYKLWL